MISISLSDVFDLLAIIGVGYLARDVFDVLEPYATTKPIGFKQHCFNLITMLFLGLSFCCLPFSGLIGLFKSDNDQRKW